MDKVTIKNEYAEFTAEILGARPSSLVAEGREWLAGYISPILFPVIGPLPDNEHIYEGKTYPMPMHGFAKDMEFEIAEKTDTSVELVLEANDETRKMFPFEFRFVVNYSLDKNKLITSYTVENIGNNKMCYGIGSHIGFNITLPKDDYEIEFNADLENNKDLFVFGNDPELRSYIPLNKGKMGVRTKFFEQGAVIMGNHNATSYKLTNRNDNTLVIYNSSDYECMTVWSDVKSPFLCIEPWSYRSCHYERKKNMNEINGISFLDSGKKKTYTYEIACELKK